MGKNIFEEYVKQYGLNKVLRFELKPQGRTQEYIEKKGLLEEDEVRAQDYVPVKKMMDKYHKEFIDKALSELQLDGLDEYYALYMSHERDEKKFKNIESKLRKQIVSCFKKQENFETLLKPGLMVQEIANSVEREDEKKVIESFQKFSTYFVGFFENRKNMYSEEEKSTAVSYRVVNQNLPKFVDNLRIFEKIMGTELCMDIAQLEKELADVLNGKKVEDFFRLESYSQTVTNTAIELYNRLIGGRTVENGKEIKGINQYVNEYNQRNKKNKEIRKLPKMKMLYKQILADKETLSFVGEQFTSDQEVIDTVREVISNMAEGVLNSVAESSVMNLLENIATYDLRKIFLSNGQVLTKVSSALWGDWSFIKQCLEKEYDEKNAKKTKNEKYYELRNKELKNAKSYSIQELNELIHKHSEKEECVETYYSSLGKRGNAEEKEGNLLDIFQSAYREAETLLTNEYWSKHGLASDRKNVAILKQLLDSVKAIEEFVKPLFGTETEGEKEDDFYGELDMIYKELEPIVPLYNKVRNYVTKKPYSTSKVKLNFQNPTLLKGWDNNKERDNLAVIFRRNNMYYLGIMDKKNNKILSENIPELDGDYYEKMEYKLLPGPNKMLPKVFFGKSNLTKFTPSKEILDNYEKGTHKKGEQFDIEKCHNLIDFFKDSIEKHEDWKKFGFQFSDTKEYADISQFYHEVEKQGYSLKFRKISKSYIDEMVESGKLYLFQIYNKDFSPYSKGTPNLHTLYWKMLFDERNLKDIVYKLNGEAEVFYRRASIDQDSMVIHPKGKKVPKKNLQALQNEESSVFEYDLIKDKRYTVDKFQFHVPITMNFCAEGRNFLNEKVMNTICMNKDINVIGIDRGERNLLYISVVSPEGKILHQQSLNKVENDKGYKTDYHALLDKREKEMDHARQNWMEINSIKELKEGYLSQAIHIITELMVKYQAVIVLEDLNYGFMNGRKKVGKQVYQKLEKMLIDKLNYLVNKKADPEEPGGVLKAYQLTNQFDSFAKLGKQSGFMFYIPAWNTSKIDPTTGFVNMIHAKYTSKEEAKEFIQRFEAIRFNEKENYFEFELNYKNFTDKEVGKRTKWTVCSYDKRLRAFKNVQKNNQWDSEEIDITELIRGLLQEYGVEIGETNLIQEICKIETPQFYKRLFDAINLVFQMRNSKPNTNIDYMLSPVKNVKGEFFDTRKYDEKDTENNYYPEDADANGAYNIARKGLWALQRIREDGKKAKLAISNKEWLEYAQENIVL